MIKHFIIVYNANYITQYSIDMSLNHLFSQIDVL